MAQNYIPAEHVVFRHVGHPLLAAQRFIYDVLYIYMYLQCLCPCTQRVSQRAIAIDGSPVVRRAMKALAFRTRQLNKNNHHAA